MKKPETLSITSTPTALDGCYLLQLDRQSDHRGSFLKLHQSSKLDEIGQVVFREIFLTKSHHGVLRGLHYQAPPFDQVKVVSCISGSAFDVVLDLRPGKTFGQHLTFNLTESEPTAILIPRGCAHGFYVTGTHADFLYFLEREHQPEFDHGFHWGSAGIQWPIPKGTQPILSARDTMLTGFKGSGVL